jgi:tetraacyldisaccharide 4'-kinase
VTRGYSGNQKGPLKVNSTFHTATDVGDESLLLAKQAPTWVAKIRPQGVQKAIEDGAQLIILDDGHQTTSLYKNLSFVVVDLFQGFGNRSVIPAGPLREGLKEGLKRTDALIGIGEGEKLFSQPFFKAQSVPHPLTLPANRVIAFCGLGFPQKFYKTLQDLGVDLIATESFPDHYKYKEEDLLRLHNQARYHEAVLVTTRKDMVKIPPSWQSHLHVLDISIEFEDSEGVVDFIFKSLDRHAHFVGSRRRPQ